jgi:hypothetical protein
MLVVFALVLFATERVPIDVTAILIMVLEPWAALSARGYLGVREPGDDHGAGDAHPEYGYQPDEVRQQHAGGRDPDPRDRRPRTRGKHRSLEAAAAAVVRVDTRGNAHAHRDVDEQSRERHRGPVDRGERVRVRPGGHVRRLDGVRDARRRPDFVYGPGGYTLPDFIRVGAPLQFLRSIVTVRGVAFFWGVRV